MKILAFDTSDNILSVAVSNGYEILSYIQDNTPASQAEKLLPAIEEALKQANIAYEEIECLAVTNGPGSFTGIRVALACTKALLINNNIKATAVNNFEIHFYRAQAQIKDWDKIIVILNAYRNQLYVQVFNRNNKEEPLLLNYEECINLMKKQNPENKIICAGSGLHLIYENLLNLPNVSILPRFTKIKALHICRYVYKNMQNRVNLPILPLYIRQADAKLPQNVF